MYDFNLGKDAAEIMHPRTHGGRGSKGVAFKIMRKYQYLCRILIFQGQWDDQEKGLIIKRPNSPSFLVAKLITNRRS